MVKSHPLFEKAKIQTKTWRQNEIDLIATLREIEEQKIFVLVGFTTMRQMCIIGLDLTESQADTLIGVSRKCAVIPELKVAIDSGKFSPAKARKMLSVIKTENSQEWIEKATKLTERQLEKEVAKANPQSTIHEKIRPVAENLNRFECGIDDETEELLNVCRDLVCKRLGKAVSWNEALKVLSKDYRKLRDPMVKAQRVLGKPRKVPRLFPGTKRPADVYHQVALRDQDECQEITPHGKCRTRRFTNVHHIVPVAEGGRTTVDNLITLCRHHHDLRHDGEFSGWKQARS